MTKADFISLVADKGGFTKKDAGLAIDAFTQAVTHALTMGESVGLIGFGTFSVAHRDARTARVPSTGDIVDVPATTVAKFKVGKNLKDSVAASTKGCKAKKKCGK